MEVMLIAAAPIRSLEFDVESSPGLTLNVKPDEAVRPSPIRKVTIGLAKVAPQSRGQATIRFRDESSKGEGEAVVRVMVAGE